MALDPSVRYPAQIDTTTDPTGYPHGAAKNILATGDGTGTPWEKDLVNDIFGMQQELLDKAGATPSGTPDKVGASQYVDAIDTIIDQEFVKSRSLMVPFQSARPTDSNWVGPGATGGAWVSPFPANQSYLILDLGNIVPNGATITALEASVNPETGRSTGNRMELTAYVETLAWGSDGSPSAGSALGTQEDDGSSGQQIIPLTGLTEVVDLATKKYLVAVRCGSGGGSLGDFVHGVRVTFNQVSPRKAA